MNPYTRAVLFIVRLVAAAFITFGALQLGAEYVARRENQPGDGPVWLAAAVICLTIGLVLFMKGYALARKLTEDFD